MGAGVDPAALDRYADLVVRVGAGVADGQYVAVAGHVEHAPMVRALTRAAYDAGARRVEALYVDQHVQREFVERAPEAELGWTAPWKLERFRWMVEEGAARIHVAGDPHPRLLDDVPPERLAAAQERELLALASQLSSRHSVNWTIAAYPNEAWAEDVYGEPDVERLWREIAYTVRLDEDDPVAAWRAHLARLDGRAEALNARRLDSIRFRGPGTDLTIGVHPDAVWTSARMTTTFGREFVANMPTEEVYTAPERGRAEGVVRSTRPLRYLGAEVLDLELRFEGGRIVEVDATTGAQLVRDHLAQHESSEYLGEIALVDGDSRVGCTGTVFNSTLFDENATCHIAFGAAVTKNVRDAVGQTPEQLLARNVNRSTTHVDFMVGGPEVEVDGLTAGGDEIAILRDERWVLGA